MVRLHSLSIMNEDTLNLNPSSPIVAKFTGVTDIETNVAAKSVVVTHTDGISPLEMLDKLTKVRTFVFFVELDNLCMILFIIVLYPSFLWYSNSVVSSERQISGIGILKIRCVRWDGKPLRLMGPVKKLLG